MVGEAESSQSDLCRASLSWTGHRNISTLEVSLHRHSFGRTFPLWWNEGLSLLHTCRESKNSKWVWEEESQMVPPPLGGRDVLWIILWGQHRMESMLLGRGKVSLCPTRRALCSKRCFLIFWLYSERLFCSILVEEGFSLFTNVVWDL